MISLSVYLDCMQLFAGAHLICHDAAAGRASGTAEGRSTGLDRHLRQVHTHPHRDTLIHIYSISLAKLIYGSLTYKLHKYVSGGLRYWLPLHPGGGCWLMIIMFVVYFIWILCKWSEPRTGNRPASQPDNQPAMQSVFIIATMPTVLYWASFMGGATPPPRSLLSYCDIFFSLILNCSFDKRNRNALQNIC